METRPLAGLRTGRLATLVLAWAHSRSNFAFLDITLHLAHFSISQFPCDEGRAKTLWEEAERYSHCSQDESPWTRSCSLCSVESWEITFWLSDISTAADPALFLQGLSAGIFCTEMKTFGMKQKHHYLVKIETRWLFFALIRRTQHRAAPYWTSSWLKEVTIANVTPSPGLQFVRNRVPMFFSTTIRKVVSIW